jgi:hypothetical protein
MVNDQKSQIMPRPLVFFAGIAKTHDEFHQSIPENLAAA